MKIVTITCSVALLLASCADTNQNKNVSTKSVKMNDSTENKSQTEINLSEEEKYILTKAKLEKLYNKILTDYSSDTIFVNNLIASQVIWLKFRETEILMKYPNEDNYREGSAFNSCYFNYLTELTTTRIQTLKKWDDGAEDGDYCSGTIRIK